MIVKEQRENAEKESVPLPRENGRYRPAAVTATSYIRIYDESLRTKLFSIIINAARY
jgi:hypothetical protein